MGHKKSKRKSKQPKTFHKCSLNIAPNCKIWFNPRTVKEPLVCNRCYQSKSSRPRTEEIEE